MARKRWKQDEIVAILREAERVGNIQEVIRKHGISDQTFYRWRKMYGGVDGTELAKLKKLEEENRRLKQLAGDQAIALQNMREKLEKRAGLQDHVGPNSSPRCQPAPSVQGSVVQAQRCPLRRQAEPGQRSDPP